MRKSNNYSKFLEYIAFGVGGNHGDAVYTDNGVLECVAEARVEHLEGYSKLFNCKYGKMAMDSDTWLKFKVVLVNDEVIEVYYVADSHETHIDTIVLDNFRTQKDVLSTVHQKVVEFFLNSDRFCKLEESSEESSEESTTHDTIETLPPHIYNETYINPVFMKCQDDNLLPYNCNKCDNKKVRKDSFYGMFGGFPSISDMYNNKCFCCPADRPGNRCCGEKWCAETWKRYEAITNPEWHHVRLSTLANIDFDMIDEKRQSYLSLYREVKELIHDLRKCKSVRTYEKRLAKMYNRNADLVDEHKVTSDFIRYVTRKISMCNVESGLWASANEESTGYHKSRRYNQLTMRY